MKAAALLVPLAFVVALCGSCNPVVVAQQSTLMAKTRLPTCATLDTTKIVELDPGFVASTYGQCPWVHRHNGPAPMKCPNNPVQTSHPTLGARLNTIQGIIANAFTAAPQHLKDELCTVDNIFIDATVSSRNAPAWGMLDRSRTNAQGADKKYIGISVALFFPQNPLQPYGRLETSIVKALLEPPPPPLPSDEQIWLDGLTVQANTGTDTLVTSTLAVLAHEMGHIIWWNEDIPDTACLVSPATPQGISFHEIAWKKNAVNPHGFHGFGQGRNRSIIENFTRADMASNFSRDQLNTLVTEMQSIYDGQKWTGLFAFTDADEDFIETYKYWALTNASGAAKLSSLSIAFNQPNNAPPQNTRAVVTNGLFGTAGTALGAKRAWIEQWVQGPVPGGCIFPP
jgi:hypothetical protein